MLRTVAHLIIAALVAAAAGSLIGCNYDVTVDSRMYVIQHGDGTMTTTQTKTSSVTSTASPTTETPVEISGIPGL